MIHGLSLSRAKTRHSTTVGSMSGQRRRRWPDIDPTLCQYLVFAGIYSPFCIVLLFNGNFIISYDNNDHWLIYLFKLLRLAVTYHVTSTLWIVRG